MSLLQISTESPCKLKSRSDCLPKIFAICFHLTFWVLLKFCFLGLLQKWKQQVDIGVFETPIFTYYIITEAKFRLYEKWCRQCSHFFYKNETVSILLLCSFCGTGKQKQKVIRSSSENVVRIFWASNLILILVCQSADASHPWTWKLVLRLAKSIPFSTNSK